MNLIELSKRTGLTPEELRVILRDRYHRVVLHDLAQVNAGAEADLLAEYSIRSPPVRPVRVKKPGPRKPGPDRKRQRTETLELLRRVQAYDVFIDTCSLLHAGFFPFYALYRKAASRPLYVPYVVKLELEKKLHDPRLHARASRVLELIRSDDNIIILGDEHDLRRTDSGEKRVHADAVFVEKLLFIHNNSRSVLLLTQDKAMTADVLEINNMRSRRSKAVVMVRKLTPDGFLLDPHKEETT